MLKLFLVSVLAIHCNAQFLSIGGADYGRTVLLSPYLNGVSSLGSYGLDSLGYTNYGGLGQLGTQSLYGSRPLGGIGLNSYVQPLAYSTSFVNPANLGFGVFGGLRPQALNLVSAAQPISEISTVSKSVPVAAAVKQLGRTIEYRAHPYNDELLEPQNLVVEPSDIPINIHFKSRSSTVRLSQEHIPGEPGTIEQTRSQDEPSIARHEVVKPVIQEVREVVQPYRRVIQELNPVIEKVQTIVNKGEGVRRRVSVLSKNEGLAPNIPTQYSPYQTVQQYAGYPGIVQPNSYQTTYGSVGIPYAQQVFNDAIRAFGGQIGSTFDTFGQTFGSNDRQRPIDDTEYTRTFTKTFGGNNQNRFNGGRPQPQPQPQPTGPSPVEPSEPQPQPGENPAVDRGTEEGNETPPEEGKEGNEESSAAQE